MERLKSPTVKPEMENAKNHNLTSSKLNYFLYFDEFFIMQKFYILFFIQVQCSDCGLRCGWADKYNGSYTECDDSELEKYFKDAQYKDPDVSGKEVFKEH